MVRKPDEVRNRILELCGDLRIMLTLEQFKIRWFRWLGQKTRCDKDTWVTLIDVNWSSWAHKVLNRVGPNYPVISPASRRVDVYYIFRDAISEANMEELRDLDRRYVNDLIERGLA